MTTDPTVLGVLAWASAAITVLGFAIAIWQILKVKGAAEAARDAASGLAQQVRSRELLAKLGDAHTHLEAARDHVGRGEQQLAVMRLELSSACAIDAREISRAFAASEQELEFLIVALNDRTERLTAMPAPISSDPGLVILQVELRRDAGLLQRILARWRYRYDVDEE